MRRYSSLAAKNIGLASNAFRMVRKVAMDELYQYSQKTQYRHSWVQAQQLGCFINWCHRCVKWLLDLGATGQRVVDVKICVPPLLSFIRKQNWVYRTSMTASYNFNMDSPEDSAFPRADHDVSRSVVWLFMPKSDVTQKSSEQCTHHVLTAENATIMVK